MAIDRREAFLGRYGGRDAKSDDGRISIPGLRYAMRKALDRSKAGVKASVALDVINASSGRSNTSMNLFPERVLTRAFPRTFRLALLEKDIGIAAEFLRQQRVPSPLTQLAADLLRVARTELGEEADHVETVKLVERWATSEIE